MGGNGMEGTILIKLYRNAISCGDYSDSNLGNFERRKKDAAEFARSHGKRLLFTVCQALEICGFDAFCEIVTDTELTEEEIIFYKKTVEGFCGDADICCGTMKEYLIPAPIFVYSVKNMRTV